MKKKMLTTEDVSKAEMELIKYSQRQTHAEVIKDVQQKNPQVKRASSIFKLDSYLQDGVLKVGDRLNRSAMPEEAKHPALLNKQHRIAYLILNHIHQEMGHGCRNYCAF